MITSVCANQKTREQCHPNTVTQLPRTELASQCLHHTVLYIYSLPVYGSKSSRSLRASSVVMPFNVVSCRAVLLQVSPHSGIAYCTGFFTLPLGKLCCFLLHPFHELIHAKYCYYLSCLPLWSSCHFILCCCPFKFTLPGLCYCLPAAALSHHHFSCLTESKLVGCRAPFCITVNF